MKEDFYPPLFENEFYHIYNRGNNRENIFYTHENYLYFLRKYDEYLSPFVETYSYCLLPNHFHLLVRVKTKENVEAAARLSKFLKLGKSILETDLIISEAFRRFFMSYAKSINKQQARTGSLFQKNFKRKHITSESYFSSVIHYIHANPQLHGICADYKTYAYSSYNSHTADKPTKLNRKEVLDWFGGSDGYIKFHEANYSAIKDKREFMIEDD